ncbi:uncharacterized protein LOC100184462 isoform X1 [Ciona intestinalis]
METHQVAPTIIVPTLCPQFNQSFGNYDVSAVTKQQLLHPVLSGQHLLLPSSGGPLLIQMHQVLPFLPQDTGVQATQYPDVLPHPTVMFPPGIPPMRCLASVNPGLLKTSNIPDLSNMTQNALHHDVTIAQTIHRTQRKKKISPSAKRRSRLRLIAFLESKKEKELEEVSVKKVESTEREMGHPPNDISGDVIDTNILTTSDVTSSEVTSLPHGVTEMVDSTPARGATQT